LAVASLVVAIIALLVAIIVAVVERRQASRITAIQEARRSEEVADRQAAHLVVQFEPIKTSGGVPGRRLVIHDDGPAAARDIDVELDPQAEENGPELYEPPWPLTLQVGQRFEVMAIVSASTPMDVGATVRWSDERGPHEDRRSEGD